jgi:dienelactone hydrolase
VKTHSDERVTAPQFMLPRSDHVVFKPVPVYLDGVVPHQPVRLVVSCRDSTGLLFQSWGDFRADAEGIVDPASQSPVAGSYQGVDPFGLWWSMESHPARPFTRDVAPIPTILEAKIAGKIVARCEFIRARLAHGVALERIHERDIRATLFRPPKRSAAGVMVLGGSEGGCGFAEELAALIAAHGFVSLAVAYFGAAGLEKTLVGIPLERIEAAAAWLLERTRPACSQLGLVGMSRGAELALLVATRSPHIGAVVALSPTSVVWPGLNSESLETRAAWTAAGAPIAFARPARDRMIWRQDLNTPLELKGIYEDALDDPSTSSAEIQVERIRGPVLLVSGGDDRIWPATRMAEAIMTRLSKSTHHFEHQHLVFHEAGHGVGRAPGLPAPATVALGPGSAKRVLLGGTRAANARSGTTVWPRVIDFLARSLACDPCV